MGLRQIQGVQLIKPPCISKVVENEAEVAGSVLDKAYMGQLVGVQHNRGAKGGLVFAKR